MVSICLAMTYQEVAEQWDYGKNGELTTKDVTKGSRKSVWWKCEYRHETGAVRNQV